MEEGGWWRPPIWSRRSDSDGVRRLGDLFFECTGWAVVAALAWLAAYRRLSLTRAANVMVLLEALTPLIFLPAYPLLLVALIRRRPSQAVAAAALIVIHLASVAPALGTRSIPPWASRAPHVEVLSANLFDANPSPRAAASFVLAQRVDVLVLVEVSAPMMDALVDAGIARKYPFRQTGEFGASARNIEAIYSRLPLSGSTSVPVGVQTFQSTVVSIGAARLRLLASHVQDPLNNSGEWATELDDLRAISRARSGPFVIAGDFNSTRWNPRFGKLLGSGLHDASESRGQGLTFSWPEGRLLPFPVMRLDHGLGSRGAEPLQVRNIRVPGSDHRGLVVTWAVQPS